MKRTICIILSLSLVFSLCTVRSFASERNADLFSDVAKEANELLNNEGNMASAVSNGVIRVVGDVEVAKVPEQMSFFNAFMTGAKTISLGLSLVNGTVSFLKLIGVMEDPTAAKLNTIYDCVLEIQETVNTIDRRTEDMQKSLVAQASTATYNFRQDRYDSFRQSWNEFFNSSGSYDEMKRLIDAYQSELNLRMIDYAVGWQDGNEADIRVLYTEDYMPLLSGSNLGGPGVALSRQPSYSDDAMRVSQNIVLPGKYIVPEDLYIDSDTYLSLLEKAIGNGVRKAIEERALIASDETFYDKLDAMDEEARMSFIDQLSRDFLDAVSYDAAYETANMKYNVGTFASAVYSTFTTFSNTMLGANGVTSPLESGLSKLSLTHAFEGEVRKDADAVCGYLAEIAVAYGEFTAFVTAMDRSLSSKTKAEVVDRALRTACYPICYHDSFVTGHDNYCYPLNALIDYSEVRFEADYTYKNSYEPKEGTWRILGGNFGSTDEGARDILNNNRMISKEDMALLYLYYQAAVVDRPGLDEFNDYLDAIGVLPEAYRNYQLCPFLPGMSPVYLMAAPAPYDLMKRKVSEYQTKDKKWGQTIQLYKSDNVKLYEGALDYSKEGESTVFFHDKMRAGVFDSGTPGLSLEARMQSDFTLAERAYTYYVLGKSYGAGKYVYVTFADPDSNLFFDYQSGGTSTLTIRSRTYGLLSYSKNQVRSRTAATIFGDGNVWIIGGAVAVVAGVAISAVCVTNKKKKKEEEAEKA